MRRLIENWHTLLAKPWDAMALALLSGAWVGTERQRREKAAGVRTMALVALGSCTFTLVGRWEHSVFGGGRESKVSLVFNPDHGKASIKLEHVLAEFSIAEGAVERGQDDQGHERWTIHYRLPERAQHEFLAALAQMPEVVAIERPASSSAAP